MRAAPITVEQYEHFESPVGFRDELIEGEIVLSPEPKPLHQEIAHRICTALERCLGGSEYLARQRTNMLMRADDSMPSPDVFVIDKARWKAAIEGNGYPVDSPQLAVEVISPGNRKKRIAQKVKLYLKNGAGAVWVVYPRRKQVEVWAGADAAVFGPDDSLMLPAPLPQVGVKVSEMLEVAFF